MNKVSKSPWLLHYDASSCNGCDIEVLDCLTPKYDIERFGIINTGDPFQADILLITGGVNSQTESVVKQTQRSTAGTESCGGSRNLCLYGRCI